MREEEDSAKSDGSDGSDGSDVRNLLDFDGLYVRHVESSGGHRMRSKRRLPCLHPRYGAVYQRVILF